MTKLKLFIFICFCTLSTITQAQQAPYTLQPSDVDFSDGEITDYINTIEKNIIIPDNFDGVAVETIGDAAFEENKLTEVIIGNSVTSIGEDAFFDNQLTEVSIPNSVKSIGEDAFGENKLTEVSIGNSVKIIGDAAFAGNKLTNVSIPNSVESIGSWAFQDNKLTEVIIGNSVESIGIWAFSYNGLTEVIIGNSVTSIGEDAFHFNKLTEVIIPNSVKSIGSYAFQSNDLTHVSIGNSVETIGGYAFQNNQLTEVIIPNSVKSIGDNAFRTNQLAEVSIGNSVKIIGDAAFAGNKLTNVSIPNSVESIGSWAFQENKLTEVIIGNSVESIGNNAFSFNELAEVIIGNSVTSIGESAFYDNTGLTSFNLPTHYQGYSYSWTNSKKSGDEITDLALSYELDEGSKGDAVDFTITYNLDGGTNDANNPANYTIETDPIILADATKDGYTFEGWYSDSAFTTGNEVTEIATGSTEPKEFFAKFSDAITYDITYNLNGGTNDANNPADYTVETATITLADASKDGYTFEGWYSEDVFTNQVTEIATGSTKDVVLYAKFDAITYDITYTLDGGTNDANNPADYTVESATITLANASKDGYTFEGWYSDAAFTADNEVTEITTGSTEPKEFFAKFSDAITYDIAYTLDGGTNAANNPADYTVETATITLADASKVGYTFEGWYSDATFTADNEVTEIATGSTGTKKFFAKFSDAITYNITYTLDGGTNDANNPADYTVETATITLEDASKDGYTFEGWYSDAAFTTDNEVTEIATGSTGPKEFFAKFSDAITYDIAYTLDGGTNAANNPADYTVETATITLEEASKDGYTFEGWYSEAAFTADNEVTEIATGSTGTKKFFAKFSDAITYDIAYTLDGGTNAANNPADYTVETATITLANASKTGRTFKGWYSEAAFTNQVTEIATGSTGDISLYAKYSDEYTLQLSDVDFSDGEITAYTNTTEKNIIIPDNFNDVAVTFIGEDAFQNNQLTQVSIPSSVTSIGEGAFSDNTGLTSFNLPAHYQGSSYPWSNGKKSGDEITDFGLSYLLDEGSKGDAVDFTISYTLDGGTNAANNPADYTVETATITLENASKDRYTFEGWYSDAAFTADNEVTEIATGSTGDVILYAKFNAITYNITYTLDEGTNAANNPADYTVETATITLENASKDRYTFEGWYSDAAFTADNEVTEIATGSTGDVILYAKFNAITYNITYTLDGGTNAANNPADYTVETATITLEDASKDGYTFEGWYSEATFTNQVTDIATGSTGPKEFFAKFSDAITYDITYTLDEGTNAANNPADYTVETATITLADATKDGYTFEGWYSEAAFTNQVTEIATGSTGDVVLFAKYSEIALGIYTTNIKVFNFYPNPSIDFIQTELEVSSLTIRSISGSKVKQFEGGSFFDISNLKSGVYILLAIDKNGDTYKSKLLKE